MRPSSPSGITVVDGAALPDALADGLPPERLALWSVERDLWAPRTLSLSGAGGGVSAAALVAGRPRTAYRKIVDVIASDAAGFRSLLEAAIGDVPVTRDGSRPAPVVVKFEEHTAIAAMSAEYEAVLGELGFTREPDPLPSVPSTRPGDPSRTRGWARWPGGAPTRRAPYYGQTTDVTCGAVSALIALEGEGLGAWGAEHAVNHSRELDFWRRATNLPACEPVGLAVATAEEIAKKGLALGRPRVILSAEGPVLLEDYADQPDEARLRTQLQDESLRRAEAMGLEIERRWAPAEEIRGIVAGGGSALLLIALAPLVGDPSPHWVLAHDVIGDALIVSDPWVEAEHGESWVDASALPIPLDSVELIARWGEPAYRGVVILPR